MGNTASTERGGHQHQRNEKLIVKPPPEWTAHTEAQKFIVVSPQSDISNPSQIRHPHHHRKTSTMTSKTPMRKRTSKVVSKVGGLPAMQHNLTTNLPEPGGFYFDPSSTTDPSVPVTDSQDQVLIPEDGKRRLQVTIKAKATRARRILQGCWKEQKEALENCYRENPNGDNERFERFQSISPIKLRRSNTATGVASSHIDKMPAYGHAKGPQFIPEIEEEDEEGLYDQNTMSPRQVYLHDEESYMNRITQPKHDANGTPLMLVKGGNIDTEMYSSENSVGGDSPVAKLFERRGHSDSDLLLEAKRLLHESSKSSRNSCPEKAEHTPAATTEEERIREPNTVEREIQKQIDEQEKQLQFESKSEQIGRVKRLRESYLQKLESTRRLSQEEDARRQSIVEQTRDLVISEEEFESCGSHKDASKEQEPESPPDERKRNARPEANVEGKENAARGRHSAPILRSTNAEKPSKPQRKSEPILNTKRTAKNDLPVLLKIAGWEETTKKTDSLYKAPQPQEEELPAVLQLAGWRQAANKKKQPTTRCRATASMEHANVEKPVTETMFRESDDAFKGAAKPLIQERTTHKVEAHDGDRATKQDISDDDEISEEENRIPMPFELHRGSNDPPKETPVVKKMSRMLLQTQTFVPLHKEPQQFNPYGNPLTSSNLDDSMESDATPFSEVSGRSMITQDALVNAAFLFSPSYVENDASLLRIGDSKSESTTTISTTDSRNRLLPSYASTVSTHGRTIRNWEDSVKSSEIYTESETSKPSGIYTASCESTSEKENASQLQSLLKTGSSSLGKSTDSADRHVRFSIGNQVIVSSARKTGRMSEESLVEKSPLRSDDLEVPGIENKMSDLTDIFSTGRSSIVSLESNKLVQTLAKEPVEALTESSDDTPTAKESEMVHREPSPPSNWSYSVDMDNGVTPLRSGRGGHQSNATNSPHKRFNEAKSKFSMVKTSPAKKRSPVKQRVTRSRHSGGIVHARVAAMESRTNGVSRSPSKTRRDTLAHKAIAPRRALLKSPHFKNGSVVDEPPPELKTVNSQDQTKRSGTTTIESIIRRPLVSHESPPVDPKPAVNAPAKRFSQSAASLSTGYHPDTARSLDEDDHEDDNSDSDSDDVFGAIRHANTVDEEDKPETENVLNNLVKAHYRTTNASHSIASTEIEEDDFAAILQYQTSIDEDDESTGELTTSTIQRNRVSTGSSTVMSGSTAPTVVRRSSVGEHSTISGGTVPTVVRRSSVLSGSSVPTVVRHEAAEVHRSSYPPRSVLPFRDAALVRPTEQTHVAAPGALVLSPMQRTPMQAMKWRALAAAEKEKTERFRVGGRKSLSERHPNVVGHY